MRHGQPVVSHCVTGAIAERPARAASRIRSGDMPAPHTAPVPVTTTRGGFVMRRVPAFRRRADAVDFFGMADDYAAVRAAEAERVGHRYANALPPRRAGDEVEVAVGVALDQVRVDRHFAALDRQRADRDFDRAGRRDQVPHRALGRAHVDAHDVGAEDGARRRGLAAVVHSRRRPVRVQVVDVRRRGAGVRERGAHRLDRPVAVRRRIGDPVARTANCRRRRARRRSARPGGARPPTPRAPGSRRPRPAGSRCAWRRTGGSRAAASRCRPTAPRAGRSRKCRSG